MEIIWLKSAVIDLQRLHQFILDHNPRSAHQAAQKIKSAVTSLRDHPELGKPVDECPEFRDLAVSFGASGYILRYRNHKQTIYIVHIRHYRENDFYPSVM